MTQSLSTLNLIKVRYDSSTFDLIEVTDDSTNINILEIRIKFVQIKVIKKNLVKGWRIRLRGLLEKRTQVSVIQGFTNMY